MSTEFENRFYDLYREFFRHAEANRRWNLEKDIAWDKVNPNTSDRITLIVEGFSAVEMYLPDYTSKILHLVRRSRGRAWFQANWGYEESKHSMALEEWLVRAGKRTEKQVREYADSLLQQEWELPFETPHQMMVYTSLQELATQLNYRKLRVLAREEGDMALASALSYISRDEAAHYKFFKDGVRLLLEEDRDRTLEDIQFVLKNFKMPAIDLIANWQDVLNEIVYGGLFSPKVYLQEVVQPTLKAWAVSRAELKALAKGADEPDLEKREPPKLNFIRATSANGNPEESELIAER